MASFCCWQGEGSQGAKGVGPTGFKGQGQKITGEGREVLFGGLDKGCGGWGEAGERECGG